MRFPSTLLLTLGSIAILLTTAMVSPAIGEDLGAVIASDAERAGDHERLRDEWWQLLQSQPDSELASAILTRWSETFRLVAGEGPSAADWRRLADATKNGWNRTRMLGRAYRASRQESTPWTRKDLGLLRGMPRSWLALGPIGEATAAELFRAEGPLLNFDRNATVAGTHAPVSWRELPLGPDEASLTPSRVSWRNGAITLLRSRFESPTSFGPGMVTIATRGSLRVFLDGEELATIDRRREHLPRVVRIPIHLTAGPHTVGLVSDGSPVQLAFRNERGHALPLRALDPAEVGLEAGWRPRPDGAPVGLPDLSAEPVSAADRATRILLAIADEDLMTVDRLFPENPLEGSDALPMAIAAEAALRALPWLPSEVVRGRQEAFRSRALAVEPNFVPIGIAQARTLASEDRLAEALAVLDPLFERTPNSLSLWRTKMRLCEDGGWRTEEESALARLVELAPDHPTVLRDQRAHAERLGRLDKIVAIDRRLYELDPSPSSASAWTRHLADRGEMEEIARVLTTVEARTADPRSLLSLRRQLARRFGEEEIYRTAILPLELERQPEDPVPWERLTTLQIEAGDLDGALASLERAAALEPGSSSRAERIAHLKEGRPLPGNAARPAWEVESVSIETILAEAPPPGTYPGANAVLLFDQMVTDVTETDGITEMVHQVIRLESQEAVEAYSTLPTSGEVRELYVLTPDGRKLEPTGGSSAGGFTLPGLAPGALIEVRTVRRSDLRHPDDLRLGPFYFQDPDFQVAFHRSEWVVRLPADWPVIIDAKGGAPEPDERSLGSQRRLAWRADGVGRPQPEPLLPPIDRVIPNVSMHAAYSWERALPNLAANAIRDDRATPTLIAAANEILEGVTGTRAKVEALYEAACDRVTSGGGGGSATEIWWSRGGDPELLLAGLLRAAEIPFQVIYAAPSPGRIPWVNWEDPSEATFQQVLLEVLDDDGASMWVHVPGRLAPLGRLPREVQGGRALRVDRTGGTWFTLPLGDRLDEAQAIDGTLTLRGERPTVGFDGGLEIRALAGAALKEQVKDMPPFVRSRMVEQFVQRALPGSKVEKGSLEHYTERERPLRIAFEIEAPTLIQERDELPTLATTILPSQLRASFLRTTERSYPIYSPVDSTSHESLRVVLGDFRPVSLPEDVRLEGPWGRFEATSRIEEGTLILERLLDLQPFSLSAARWDEFREFCTQVDQREEERIALERATP